MKSASIFGVAVLLLALLPAAPAAAVVTFTEFRLTSAIPGIMSVIEIHVYEGSNNQATPAQGATATATSQKDASHPPSKVIDGITGTSPVDAWVSATGDPGEQLTITWADFPVRIVDRLTLWASTDNAANNLYRYAFLLNGAETASGLIDARAFGSATVLLGGQTPGPAIPEPASWALLIAGFGLVGGALRRSRRPMLRP